MGGHVEKARTDQMRRRYSTLFVPLFFTVDVILGRASLFRYFSIIVSWVLLCLVLSPAVIVIVI
ncbi:hypothetical protein B0T24DRAFT_614468 [Lasiosphaeria ovina]|uniref:Uncharacterized protein n=1 Tax=Lasiosphaeria ovina TaxID=92902 RepID=A0AAE0TTY9_9PEZI|nr:hypothetical protein B0T24DRAFT_614468 [Lasiosphaeria ovina]